MEPASSAGSKMLPSLHALVTAELLVEGSGVLSFAVLSSCYEQVCGLPPTIMSLSRIGYREMEQNELIIAYKELLLTDEVKLVHPNTLIEKIYYCMVLLQLET